LSIHFISKLRHLLLGFLLLTLFLSLSAENTSRASVILKSALVPGWGQLSVQKNRGYVFMANEILLFSGLYYFNEESDSKLTEAYDVALHYAHIRPGIYSDTYLINLGKYTTNGFDVNGYNTNILEQAELLFPDNQQAQQDYFDHNMIPDSQGWNWDSNDKRQDYRKARKESLDLKDYAKVVTGMVIANHLINIIDIARTTAHQRNLKVGFSVMPDFTPQLQLTLCY
jgi:hypothetical protein